MKPYYLQQQEQKQQEKRERSIFYYGMATGCLMTILILILNRL